MSNKTEKKPGGDKCISRARSAGNLFELISAGLGIASLLSSLISFGCYLYMDRKIYKNKKLMKVEKGGKNG